MIARRQMWRAAAVCAAAMFSLTLVSRATAATSPVRAALSSWSAAHPSTTALVWRLDETGPIPIAAFRPETPLLPASTMKLVTSAGALLSLGPEFRFETRLYAGVNSFRRGRVLNGPIYILGSGDPVLATADYSRAYLNGRGSSLGKLVKPLRAQGIRLVKGPVVADESLFDDRRTAPLWKASYTAECTPLSALAVNQNFAGTWKSGRVTSPPVAAAQRLKQTMAVLGVQHKGRLREGNAPEQGRLLSSVKSPPLRTIVGLMNRDSDNFIAEMLAKDVGAAAAGEGSTTAGTTHTEGLLNDIGVMGTGDRLVDGSGLSRSNRLAAGTLVRLLAAADADPVWGAPLIDSLPKGGEGTLRRRFKAPAISQRVHGKTGYINGVSSFAGVVESPAGVRYAFAFIMNHWDITGAKATQDRVVTLLARGAGDRMDALPS